MRKFLHNSKQLLHQVLQEVKEPQQQRELRLANQVALLAKDQLLELKNCLKRKRNQRHLLTSLKKLSIHSRHQTLKLIQAISIQTSIFVILNQLFALMSDILNSYPFSLTPEVVFLLSSQVRMTQPGRYWSTLKNLRSVLFIFPPCLNSTFNS